MVATIGENMSVRRTVAMSVGDGRRRRLRAQQGRRRPRQDRRAGGAREQGRQGGAGRLRPSARHAHRRREPGRRHGRRARSGARSSASARSTPSRPRPPASRAEIVAKMVEGRLRKEFYQQVVLLEQTFLGAGGDGKATVDAGAQGGREGRRARPSRLPSSSAMRWARASTRRTTTSPPRWQRRPASGELPAFESGYCPGCAAEPVSPGARVRGRSAASWLRRHMRRRSRQR